MVGGLLARRMVAPIERLQQGAERLGAGDLSQRLDIHTGEVVGLLGPNGAGKTTAFYMMVGLVPADGGSIRLDEQDLTSMSIDARARLGIGYLPQESSVFRRLSVADNIMAILELRAELADRAPAGAGLLRQWHGEGGRRLVARLAAVLLALAALAYLTYAMLRPERF